MVSFLERYSYSEERDLLQRSATSALYFALDRKTGGEVLLKEILAANYDRENLRELSAMAGVALGGSGLIDAANRSPYLQNIVEIFKDGSKRTVFVLEYWPYGSLQAYVEACGCVEEGDALYLLKNIALGVRALHE